MTLLSLKHSNSLKNTWGNCHWVILFCLVTKILAYYIVQLKKIHTSIKH